MRVLTSKTFRCRHIRLYFIRRFHYEPDTIVIVGAVRSPWVQRLARQYPVVTTTYLTSTVVEAALKQSGAPLEKVQKVFMTEKSVDCKETLNNLRFSELMKKAKHISIAQDDHISMKSLLMGIEDLNCKKSEIVIVGEVQLASEPRHKEGRQGRIATINSPELNDYISRCEELREKAFKYGVFDAELMHLSVIKKDGNKRQQIEITKDYLLDRSQQHVDGSAALVLTTMTNAEKYNIRPLAVIKDIALLENANIDDAITTQGVIQSMVNKTGIPISSIHHWEFNTEFQLVFDLQKHFHILWEDINPYGCISTFAQTGNEHQMGILSHIAHTLKPNEHGCVVASKGGDSIAILLQKLPALSLPNSAPCLTLFTKHPCELCDILVDELESTFPGEYDLQKVYIDSKENVRYLRLYRHDIPVLYLNGQFLCMHRLNARLLRRKLDLLKEP